MTDVSHGEDCAISFERMEQVYNADLANSWGNLVSRTLNMSAKYFDGVTPNLDGWLDHTGTLRTTATGLVDQYCACMEQLDYVGAKDVVMKLIHAANHFIEDSAPWNVAKDAARAEELRNIIADLLEAIRISALLFTPFMPTTSAEVLRRMSLEDQIACDNLSQACVWGGIAANVAVTKGDALFPRLAAKKE